MAIPKIKEMGIDCGRAGKKTIAHNHFQFNVIMCNLSAMSTKQSVSHVSVICLSSRGVVRGYLQSRPLLFINIVQYLPFLHYLVLMSTNEILEMHSGIKCQFMCQ